MRFAHSLPRPKFVGSRNRNILRLCSGKTVLHLGFVDEGLFEDRLLKRAWLHEQLNEVAYRLVGIDISVQGVTRARDLGYDDCFAGDVEKLSEVPFPRLSYDVILAPDIIEHLANPGLFLGELHRIVTPGTAIVVTTPNALSVKTLFYPIAGIEAVHPDHNFYYSPTTLRTLLEKHGFEATEIWLYSEVWRPSFRNSRNWRDVFIKSAWMPVDAVLRYSLVPLFPYFSEGMMVHARISG